MGPEVKTPQEKKTKKTEKTTEKPKETPPPVKKEKSPEKKEKAPEKSKSPEKKQKKPKDAKKPNEPKLYSGKLLLKIGDGGCRGTDWSKKGCPKFIGRVKPGLCAKECRKHSYCTAFHILKHDPRDKTYECFLFAHKDVT